MRVGGNRLKEGGFSTKKKRKRKNTNDQGVIVHKDFQGCTLDISQLGSIILALFESFLSPLELTTICCPVTYKISENILFYAPL